MRLKVDAAGASDSLNEWKSHVSNARLQHFLCALKARASFLLLSLNLIGASFLPDVVCLVFSGRECWHRVGVVIEGMDGMVQMCQDRNLQGHGKTW